MGYQAIVFDMDGVLVDSEPVHFEAMRTLLAEHGVTHDAADDQAFFGCTDREVFRQLRARHNLAPHEHDLAEEYIRRVVALLPSRMIPMSGVPTVLDGLRASGYRLALASASSPPVIGTTIDGLGLHGAFEAVVSGRDVTKGKPAPDIFLEAARRLRLDPSACVVIEDSSNGMRAAQAAGMACAVIPCRSTRDQDFSGASVRLGSLDEFPAWLRAR